MGVVTEIQQMMAEDRDMDGRYTVINERFAVRIAANWKKDFTMLLVEEGN